MEIDRLTLLSAVSAAPTSRFAATKEALLALERHEIATMVVRGGSMEPTLRSGDAVRVVLGARPWPGDIVLFVNGVGQLVSHRLLGSLPTLRGRRWLLRGDAAPLPDGWATRAQIVGVLSARIDGEEPELSLRPGLRTRLAAWIGLLRCLVQRAFG